MHAGAVARGSNPTDPYAFVVAIAGDLGLDVDVAAPGAAVLDNGRATLVPEDDLIIHEDAGSPFERAFLVAHEIGHHELGDASASPTVTEADPQRTVDAMRECADRGLGALDEDKRLIIDGSRIEGLSGPLRCYTGCASYLAGEMEDGDLVRLDPLRKRLTIFRLADRKVPFPAITSSIAVDLRRQDVILRAEDRILVRKSQVFGLSARSKQRKLEAEIADRHGLAPDKVVARDLGVQSLSVGP